MTNEQLMELVVTGDSEAKEAIVRENIKFVHYTAKKFIGSKLPYDDLVSACMFGMTKAINTFDPSKANKFITYASRCMENECLMLIRKSKKHRSDISIETPIMTDERGNEIRILDNLAVDEKLLDSDQEEALEVFIAVLRNQSERTQQIMNRYFQQRKTHHEIGKEFGITQSYVSRIIARVFKQVQQHMNINPEKSRPYQFEKEPKRMAIDVGKLKYLRMHYPQLTQSDAARILNVTPAAISNMIRKPSGKYSLAKEDSSVQDTAEKYLKQHYPEQAAGEVHLTRTNVPVKETNTSFYQKMNFVVGGKDVTVDDAKQELIKALDYLAKSNVKTLTFECNLESVPS